MIPEGHLKKFLDGTTKLKPEDKAGKFETDIFFVWNVIKWNKCLQTSETNHEYRAGMLAFNFLFLVQNLSVVDRAPSALHPSGTCTIWIQVSQIEFKLERPVATVIEWEANGDWHEASGNEQQRMLYVAPI